MPEKIKKILLIGATVFLILITGGLIWSIFKPKIIVTDSSLRKISTFELRGYDGAVENRPIYLAYEGLVYNVTAGKEYYKIGGVYHFLVGRDATVELNIAGGGIIKKKYPVVGRLSDDVLINP